MTITKTKKKNKKQIKIIIIIIIIIIFTQAFTLKCLFLWLSVRFLDV